MTISLQVVLKKKGKEKELGRTVFLGQKLLPDNRNPEAKVAEKSREGEEQNTVAIRTNIKISERIKVLVEVTRNNIICKCIQQWCVDKILTTVSWEKVNGREPQCVEVAGFHGEDIPTTTKCDVDELRVGRDAHRWLS